MVDFQNPLASASGFSYHAQMGSHLFKDHFSGQAGDYASYRPRYPDSLFAWLAEQAPAAQAAWDCATGNGQAATALATYFKAVIATDASRQQIDNATPHPDVEYRVAPAEKSGLQEDSIDLVTVGQALHWFDLPAFYREVNRVLKPGSVIAAWMYELFRVSPEIASSEIDDLVNHFYAEVVGPYWPPERRHIEAGYADRPFPFARLDAPEFEMEANWSVDNALGYLNTWSAVQRYRRARGENPLERIQNELEERWGTESRRVVWPLVLKAGRA